MFMTLHATARRRDLGFGILLAALALNQAQGQVLTYNPARSISQKRMAANAATSDPDRLLLSGQRPPLPKDRGPKVTETVGVDSNICHISDTVIEQQIQINRVVSYETVNGKITPAITSSNTLSANARLTVLIKLVYTHPEDRGKKVRISFSSFNGSPVPTSDFLYTLGSGIEDLNLGLIPTTNVVFAQAAFNPMNQSAKDLQDNSERYKPKPGINRLQFSAFGSGNGTPALLGEYTVQIYSFLEFDAVAPIILVHGTNADHTSWEEPDSVTIQGDVFRPFVPTYFGPAGYKGAWFYFIDLDKKITWNRGNRDIDSSGVELAGFIDAVLYALGSRTCHIIAHSKGGSDSRSLLNNTKVTQFIPADPVNKIDPDLLRTKIRILSLYTLGTPHLGTPLSDLAYTVASSAQYEVRSSSNEDVQAMIGSVQLMQSVFRGPAGGALLDQRADERLKQYDADQTQSKTGGHFYSVVGDADLNRNNVIDVDESKVIFPWYVTYAQATHVYNILGKVRKVGTRTIRENLDTPPRIEFTTKPLTLPNSLPEPNDLVTPFWSGIGPRANPFQVKRSTFQVKSGHSAEPLVSQFEYSTILTPGNHSILKDTTTAYAIMYQIMYQNYPLEDFQ